ncbi:MAG: methionine synthase, partial [Sulfolobales archaeon]
SKEELAHELAKIINREILELERAGARFVQIDEPALTTHPEEMEWAVEVVNEATRGVSIKLGLHVCYSNYELLSRYFDRLNVSQFALEFANRGFRDLEILRRLGDKEIGFGVVDVHSRRVESVDEVVKALRKVMDIVSPDKIYVNPDCGLKLLPREIAKAKLEVMVEGVRILRRELEKRGLTSIVLR